MSGDGRVEDPEQQLRVHAEQQDHAEHRQSTTIHSIHGDVVDLVVVVVVVVAGSSSVFSRADAWVTTGAWAAWRHGRRRTQPSGVPNAVRWYSHSR